MRQRVVLACVLLLVVSAACVNLSGLSGGAGDAGPDAGVVADAAPEASRDGGVDGPSDARDSGGTLGEATTADAGCPGHPTAILCDNFDDGPFGARWSSMTATQATLSLSQAHVWSPPSSLWADVPISDGGLATGAAGASLSFNVQSAPQKIRTSFDVYLDKVGSRSAAIGSLYLNDGLRSYAVYLFASTGGTSIVEDGTLADGGALFQKHALNPPIPLTTWIRVILDLDFGPTPSVTATLEAPPGAAATPTLDHVPITPTVTATSMTTLAGIDYTILPLVSEWSVFVDDVVVELP